ncbi:uncharacterized protein LOC143282351 [Babylonia areolata]|uniref:uncharacterized protein LOC143282351 n=1 Tax=Babylonia areolata TaxID=304850 RepID=UPI003FCF9D57
MSMSLTSTWLVAVLVVVAVGVVMQGQRAESAVNLLNSCRAQCREEEQLKAACSEQRNCDALLPNLGAFVDCLEPCRNLGNNCFQRCAFKTDRISAICSVRCRVSGASQPLAVPADVSSSGVRTGAGDNPAGSLCFKACYDSLLNAAMNRLYRKRP